MKSKESIILTFVFLLLFTFTSIGYAMYTAQVGVSGEIGFGKNGKVAITDVTLTSHNNLQNPVNPSYTDDSINFNLNFKVSSRNDIQKKYNATYSVTITNGTFYDYAFASTAFTPSVETTNNEDMVVTYSFDGIELNEQIPALTEKTFTITINMYPSDVGNFNVTGEAGVALDEDTTDGSLLASIPKNTSGDLSGDNNRVKVTATVINSYKTTKSFTFSINNKNFNLLDENGNALGNYTIAAGEEQDYDIYIYKKEGVAFPTDTQSMNIYFEPTGESKSSMGVVVLTVDKDETLTDDEPPEVEDVNATMLEEEGSVKLDFRVTDNVGIKQITIETYKKNGNSYTKVKTDQINSDAIEYTVTGLEAGTYYFKVYAMDTSDNTASSSDISTCNDTITTCARSSDIDIKWTFTVNTSRLSNARYTGKTSLSYGEALSAVISGSGNNYSSPSSLSITMGGKALTSGTDYTYNANNGELNIQKVTGDITISGSGRYTCFVEGTKIKLANGKEKNVEDIDYDDLLLVWNYDTGQLTEEYPLWIETKKQDKKYTKISFSDGSSINIVGQHAFFNTDLNLFVNALDEKNFHIGTKIAKIDKNGKIKKIKVTKIENIKKEVNYYFVGSTAYFNVIANDILTTDGNVLLSNRYGFEKNIKWPKNKVKKVMDYSYFKDILPYYMYKGFRAGESAVLFENSNVSLEEFKKYIKKEIVNPKKVKSPKTIKGKRYWMVTTSENKIINKKEYLVKEGDTYTLPKIKGVKKWYSTSENKYYKPNTKVKVWHGMHFEKVK